MTYQDLLSILPSFGLLLTYMEVDRLGKNTEPVKEEVSVSWNLIIGEETGSQYTALDTLRLEMPLPPPLVVGLGAFQYTHV